MNIQNLIIFRYPTLYQILKELEDCFNFKIVEILDEKSLNNKIKNMSNYLIIVKTKLPRTNNQLFIDQMPIKILKLLEKINVQFLKIHFNQQSKININKYIINLNSREISFNDKKLKLTEKEVNTIIYLSKINGPVSIENLQKNVWQYQSDMETHTVETHIYRLRKKIINIFNDGNFIINDKNGYQIK